MLTVTPCHRLWSFDEVTANVTGFRLLSVHCLRCHTNDRPCDASLYSKIRQFSAAGSIPLVWAYNPRIAGERLLKLLTRLSKTSQSSSRLTLPRPCAGMKVTEPLCLLGPRPVTLRSVLRNSLHHSRDSCFAKLSLRVMVKKAVFIG